MKILGLDLGVSSIGWALIEQSSASEIMPDDTRLIDWGSRIFEPGMDDDIESGKGVSRCVNRRLKRSLRIQYSRRRRRMRELAELLKENKLFPPELTPSFFVEMDSKLLRMFPKGEWARLGHVIPYLYRKNALDRELQPYELGRAIYHLAQRRGYKSNRKQELKDEDETGKVLDGIKTLKHEIEESGARTLGEYFCSLDPEVERIRSRYTERSMFEREFRLICERQRQLISPELEHSLYKVIFFQRPLKSCKGLIGECRLEAGEKRCSYSREEAQLFRIYTSVENLRILSKSGKRMLDDGERFQVLELLDGFNYALDKNGKITLAALGKILNLKKGERFSFEDEEVKSIFGNVLHHSLYMIFGERSKTMSKEEQESFWHDIKSIEKDEVLKNRLACHWYLDEDHVKIALECPIPDDYCAYSLKALRVILPDLMEGIPLHKILELQYPEKNRPSSYAVDVLPSIDRSGISLRNPVVHRTLTELRHVVNAIIARYGKPDFIRVELARSLKNSNRERERITRQNNQREKERTKIAARIANEAGIQNPSSKDILKVMLAEECGFECPYTGRHFSMTELLHGGAIHIEHIIPFSRSFDDSFRNKTLCFGEENASKGNKTPYEAYQGTKYSEILSRVEHFRGEYADYKLQLFKLKEVDADDFLARNLNDTRYASRLAMEYLGRIYGGVIDTQGHRRVQACSGGCTALVRRAWGGNYLLGEGEKVRDDHRHHAIDALTIALLAPGLVRIIADMSQEERKQTFTAQDSELFKQGKMMLSRATVSHHVVNKVRGQLHDETFYSRRGEHTYKRVRLESIKKDEIANICDRAIRLAVIQKLGGTDENTPLNELAKPEDVFKGGNNYPTLNDRNGNVANVIKAVKVLCNVGTRTIGTGNGAREVKTNGNYAISVFAKVDEDGMDIKWDFSVVTLFDACQRLKKKLPIIDKVRDGWVFKFSLKKGDIVTLVIDGVEEVCIIRKITKEEIACVPVNDARQKKDLEKYRVFYRLSPSRAMKSSLQKHQMTLFGELRRAND